MVGQELRLAFPKQRVSSREDNHQGTEMAGAFVLLCHSLQVENSNQQLESKGVKELTCIKSAWVVPNF